MPAVQTRPRIMSVIAAIAVRPRCSRKSKRSVFGWLVRIQGLSRVLLVMGPCIYEDDADRHCNRSQSPSCVDQSKVFEGDCLGERVELRLPSIEQAGVVDPEHSSTERTFVV